MTKIYSLFDRVSKTYSLPMFSSNDESMIRDFSFALSSFPKDHPILLSPKDFDLFCVGEFNEYAGYLQPITLESSPRFVFHVSDFGGISNA